MPSSFSTAVLMVSFLALLSLSLVIPQELSILRQMMVETAVLRNSNSNDISPRHRMVEFMEQGVPAWGMDMVTAYSGAWWLRRDFFLNVSAARDWADLGNREEASFRPFKYHQSAIRMTADWLDLSVEHLSQFRKNLLAGQDQDVLPPIKAQLETMYKEYIEKTVAAVVLSQNNKNKVDQDDDSKAVVSSTLALVPIFGRDSSTTLELAGTLASLAKAGLGRAVVVGLSDRERQAAHDSFALLLDHRHNASNSRSNPNRICGNMELAFVQVGEFEKPPDHKVNVPALALSYLSAAMRQKDRSKQKDEQEKWFGKGDPAHWQYVYFSEADLLLTTRPSAQKDLSKALQQGLLLAPHRLESMPHRRNFGSLNDTGKLDAALQQRTLPDHGVFAVIHDLGLEDSCCDQGGYYPSNREDPTRPMRSRARPDLCPRWGPHHGCGFYNKNITYSDPASILTAHQLVIGYAFFTVEGGLGAPLVHEGQRFCVPKQGPSTTCSIPL